MNLSWNDGAKMVMEPCEREREREKIAGERCHAEEEGDVIRKYNAMLREDLVEKEERRKKVKERVREEEEGKQVKREEERKIDREKAENETVSAKRCVGFFFCGGL